MDECFYRTIFMAYLVGLLLSINIFFFIFVNNMNDLSPNIALFILTVPPAIILLIEMFKNSKGGKK
jgi:Na+/melibiose symporter-like transporter